MLNIIQMEKLKKLAEAIKDGDVQTVTQLLEQRLDLNQAVQALEPSRPTFDTNQLPEQTLASGELPLAIAITRLLEEANGALLLFELTNSSGKAKVYVQIIEQLLKAGAQAEPAQARSYLQRVNEGYLRSYKLQKWATGIEPALVLQVSELLLQYGANPNSVDEEGRSLLLNALQSEATDLAALLLRNGADPTTLPFDVKTALNITNEAGLETRTDTLIERLLHRLDSQALDKVSSPADILHLLQRGVKPLRRNLIDFFIIAEQNDDEPLRKYLLQRGIIHYQTPQGTNLLHHLTSPARIIQLIEQGINVKAVCQATGNTPLLHCMGDADFSDESQSLNLIASLLAHGADILATNHYGNTVLHCTVANPHSQNNRFFNVNLLAYLVEQGAPLNSQNQHGITPLTLALLCRNIAALNWLLEAGADIELADHKEQRAVDHLTSCHFGHSGQNQLTTAAYQLLERSVKKGSLANAVDILHRAAQYDDCRLAEAVWAHGSVSQQQLYPLFSTAIHYCAQQFKTWLLQHLPLEYKPQAEDETLLQIAVRLNDLAVVRELLERGANAAVMDAWQNNLLQVYSQGSFSSSTTFSANERQTCLAMLDILLANVDLEHRNSRGYNALECLTSYSGLPRLSKWFLARELIFKNISLPPNPRSLLSLINAVVKYRDIRCLRHLFNHYEAIRPYLMNQAALQAIDAADCELLTELFSLGLEVNANLEYNNQPLRLLEYVQLQAVNNKEQATPWVNLLSSLLQRPGMEIHFPYRLLNSNLLHDACRMGWSAIVESLLQEPHCMPIDLRTANGQLQTPLQLAIEHERDDIACLLIQRGADSRVKAVKTGETLLHRVCGQSNLALAELLLEQGLDINATYRPADFWLPTMELSPLHCALLSIDNKPISWPLVELLIEKGVRLDTMAVRLFLDQSNDAQAWQNLLARVTLEDLLMVAPLHKAVLKADLALVTLLLNQPYAENLLHSRGREGKTALHFAATVKNSAIYHLLVQRGADQQALDYNGLSVADYALLADNLAACGFNAPPHFDLSAFHFWRQEFLLLPELRYSQDKAFQAAYYAYKLVGLLDNQEAVALYLTKHSPQNSRQPLHDICLFSLPLSEHWTHQAWSALAQQHGQALTRYLHLAPRIEALLGRAPQTLAEVQAQAKLVKYNRDQEDLELANLCAQYQIPEPAFDRVLNAYQPKQTDRLPDLGIDGAGLGKPGYDLRKLAPQDKRGFVLGAMTHCCQSIGSAGEACAMHGMTSTDGGFYVIFKRPKNAKSLNDLMAKLQQAATYAGFLQSIPAKHQRRKYAEYQARFAGQLTESELCQQLLNQLQQEYEGEIIAQSWAWLGTNDELVFDSWERLRPENDELCSIMLGAAACQAVSQYAVPKVLLGKSGQTPEDLPFSLAEQRVSPKDYRGYRDSKQQWLLAEQSSLSQKLSVTQTQMLLQHSALFSLPAKSSFEGYTSQAFIQLLRSLCEDQLQFSCLDVIELADNTPVFDGFTQSKASQQAHTYFIPIHKVNSTWACFIIQHYENSEDKTKLNTATYYLDPTGAGLPSAFHYRSCRDVALNNLAMIRAEYVKDTAHTGPW
ncbi:MAG: hypothetical protein K0S11_1550, partial [Gammaproteobacteria bacterium]|nr:hypothetical protein [Gammaproteobacteria bacterium]